MPPRMRFNHMELTLPVGTLSEEFRAEVKRFYGDLLGWATADVPLLNQLTYYLAPDDGQFILLAESDKPLQSPGFDHLGLLVDTRAEVEALLEACRKFQAQDDRMKIKDYPDLTQGPVTIRAFYVKYLLPIYFDVQCMEWQEGQAPKQRWRYVDA